MVRDSKVVVAVDKINLILELRAQMIFLVLLSSKIVVKDVTLRFTFSSLVLGTSVIRLGKGSVKDIQNAVGNVQFGQSDGLKEGRMIFFWLLWAVLGG